MLEKHVHTSEGEIGHPEDPSIAHCVDEEIEAHIAMYPEAFGRRFRRTPNEDGCGFLYRDRKTRQVVSEDTVLQMIRSGYTH